MLPNQAWGNYASARFSFQWNDQVLNFGHIFFSDPLLTATVTNLGTNQEESFSV